MSARKKAVPEDVLSGLIFRASPRMDARAIAQRMLLRHGSLGPVLESQTADLMRQEGLNRNAAQLLNLVPQLTRYLARAELAEHASPIDTLQSAECYLRAQYIGVHHEQLYLLSLDGKGRLLSSALVQQGTLDATPFYLREILEAAMRAGAEAIVLSHNHPGGSRFASKADADATLRTLSAVKQMGIILVDHIIIADGDAISMHELGPMPRRMFLDQDAKSGLLRGWLGNS